MTMHRDQSKKGKHIKIGTDWVQVSDINKMVHDRSGKKLTLTIKRGKAIEYKGEHIDFIKSQLKKEGIE